MSQVSVFKGDKENLYQLCSSVGTSSGLLFSFQRVGSFYLSNMTFEFEFEMVTVYFSHFKIFQDLPTP